MASDLEALFTVEQKLRNIFANPSFVRSRTRVNRIAGGQGISIGLLPFRSINALGDPQQHLLQALASSMSLLGLQAPLIDNFSHWCSGHAVEYDLEVASSAMRQLLLDLRLEKRHVNAVYADSRALTQIIRKNGVLDDPTYAGDDLEIPDADELAPAPNASRTIKGNGLRSTWEIKVHKIVINKTNGKYKHASLNLDLHEGFFSPRLQPHANSTADGWYIRASLSRDIVAGSIDYWFSPIFPKSMQVSVTPNMSFTEELNDSLALGSDNDVIDHLQQCLLTIELWRHKPKRQDFPMFICSSNLKHQSLGLATATLSLQPKSIATYASSGKATASSLSDFVISGTVELIITRRKAATASNIAPSSFQVAETKEVIESQYSDKSSVMGGFRKSSIDGQLHRRRSHANKPFLNSDSGSGQYCNPEDAEQLRTELDNEVAVLRNWTFMGAAAALLIQHNASPTAVNTITLLYCFTSGLDVVHARDCHLIARALNLQCDEKQLTSALELLQHPNDAEEPRSYSALDAYSLVDTTRIALRISAVDLIVMAARHYLENVMLYPHAVQRVCLPILLKIATRKSNFDGRDHDMTDTLMSQLQCAIQSWNTFIVQSIRRMPAILEASGDRMQRLLTVSNMFRLVSDELLFQLAEIAPLYPSQIIQTKQTIATNLCSQVVMYTQAFIIEGSDDDMFDSDTLIQVSS